MAQARERTCVACGKVGTKAGFVRFVRTAAGEVLVDPSGRAAGRGAYLCACHDCFATARKRRSLERALRARICEADYARLEQEFDMLCVGHSGRAVRDR